MLIIGVWKPSLNQTKLFRRIYDVYSVSSVTCFFACPICLALNIPKSYRTNSVQILTENIGYFIIALMMLWKGLYSLTLNKSLVCFLVFLYITFGSTKVGLYLEFRKYNSTVEKPLILPIWTFYNSNYYYNISCCIGICFALIGGIYYMTSLCLFSSLMIFVSAKLDMLTKSFRNYDSSVQTEGDETETKAWLRTIIKKHQFVINYVEGINNAICYLLLAEFILNSVHLASVMVQILLYSSTLTDYVFWSSYSVLVITQLFTMTWHANEIQLKSLGIADALYESKWYDRKTSVKRTIMIVMMRSQKPIYIQIGTLFPMTLSCALTTIKAAYSYVTLILQFDGH
ncbi:odorant receptor 10-like isoform X2 [Rhynchophorus ferrugineus]|uniref:odorant receptor 10-like isoform X2 n=1 Tax=Rhynchophorus ferrugineus TaxID=354439 RepID=UPI003FCE3B41